MVEDKLRSKIAQIVEQNPELALMSYQLANAGLQALKNDPEFMRVWNQMNFQEQLLEFDSIKGFIEEKLSG